MMPSDEPGFQRFLAKVQAAVYLTIAVLILVLIGFAAAYAQSTKAQLNTEVNTNFPDNTTGAITPLILRTTTNDIIASFQQAPVVNAQTGTSYAFVVGDYGKLVTFSNSSATAVTVPQATGSFATGWNTLACNLGAGVVTITPTTSTIGGLTSIPLSQGTCTRIVSDGANYQITFPVAQAGNSTAFLRPGGRLTSQLTPAQTSATTGETTLATFDVPANTLDAIGRCISVDAWGAFGADTNTKTVKLYFGSVIYTSTAIAQNGTGWFVISRICKTGSNTQSAIGSGFMGNSVPSTNSTTPNQTDTAAITVKVTGQNGTASAGDITFSGMTIGVQN